MTNLGSKAILLVVTPFCYFGDGARNPVLVGEDLFRAADAALYRAKREGRKSGISELSRAARFTREVMKSRFAFWQEVNRVAGAAN